MRYENDESKYALKALIWRNISIRLKEMGRNMTWLCSQMGRSSTMTPKHWMSNPEIGLKYLIHIAGVLETTVNWLIQDHDEEEPRSTIAGLDGRSVDRFVESASGLERWQKDLLVEQMLNLAGLKDDGTRRDG